MKELKKTTHFNNSPDPSPFPLPSLRLTNGAEINEKKNNHWNTIYSIFYSQAFTETINIITPKTVTDLILHHRTYRKVNPVQLHNDHRMRLDSDLYIFYTRLLFRLTAAAVINQCIGHQIAVAKQKPELDDRKFCSMPIFW